jgi:hypothetical protein
MPMKEFEAKTITAEQVPTLPPSYLMNAHNLCEMRAAEAGFRLAEEIKAAIGN